MRVLYVEDSTSDADLTLRELRSSAPDIHLDVVGSVAEALALLNDLDAAMAQGESARFELVLLDLSLPDGSGLNVLAEVRHRSLPLAVVVLTGSGDEQTVLAALRAGADDYLAKRHEYWAALAPTLRAALTRFRLQAARRARPLRLLYAERNEHDVSLTRIHLATQAPFIRLEVVHTADEVLARLPQSGPAADVDVVLLDYRLPGMNALEALKEIFEVRGLDVPVIVTTSHGTEDVALQALKLGAADFVVKSPGYLQHLPATVEAAFHRAQAARENAVLVRREQDLHESEERFRQLAENIKEVFWLTDPSKNEMLYISPAYEEIWGRTRKSLYSSPHDWVDAIHPDDRARVVEAAQTRQVRGDYVEEYRIVRSDGSVRWIRDKAFPVVDKEGKVFRVAGIAEDITERKQFEDEIRETRNFLASIFDNIPNSIFVKDARDLRFVRVNTACEKLTGYSEEELLGKSDYDFFPKEQADFFVAKDRETLASNQRVFMVEETITSKDGTEKILQTKKFPILDKDGHPQYLLGLSEDITARKWAEEALQKSETHLRAIIENEPECVKVVSAKMKLLEMNQAGLAMFQAKSLTEAQQQTLLEFVVPEHRAAFVDLHKRVMNGESGTLEFEVIGLKGAHRWLETRAAPLRNSAGEVQQLLGITRDITERRNQERKFSRLSRIHAVLSGINSAIVRIRDRRELFQEACRIIVEHGQFSLGWIAVLDHATGKLIAVAQAGLPENSDADSDFFNGSVGLVPAGAAEVVLREKHSAIDNVIEDTPDVVDVGHETDSLKVRRAAIELGAKSVIALPLIVEGQIFGILTLYAPERNFFDYEEVKLLDELAGDISFGLEFIAKGEKVDYLAYYDILTGLPNRSLFFDRLTHQLGTAARDGLTVALVVMDIDRFRLINDTLGRQAGDALIRMMAQRIKETFRDQDSVARVGSNSFAVAVSGAWHAADATRILEAHNHQLFGQPFLLGTEQMRVSAAAGVAMFPGDGDTPEVLFANAEAALRQAKEQTALFLFYNPGMNARVANSLRIENKLRRALDNGEMVLWYQPKVSVRTRKILGFEALMRWQDPESGMVPPAQFIPLMEQTGLILEAGRWALFQVARDCSTWSAAGIKPPRVAVNVSPIQLRQKDFLTTMVEAAHKSKEAGALLDVEITESTIMTNVDAIIPILQSIRGLAVGIAVDDFGTGYSSLAYVARLPIQDLKIDRSFIVGMTQDEDSLAIVRSIVSLAHSLRLNVVAEGVETEEQAAILLELGCDEMQGYLISRPVPSEQVPELLRQQMQAVHDNPAKKVSATTKKNRGGKKNTKRR